MLAAEFLTKIGPLLIVVAYAPTDQDSTEEKDRFYSDHDRVMSNGLEMVMGDFHASVSERMKRVVGPHGLGRRSSDNGMYISNTFFPHKHDGLPYKECYIYDVIVVHDLMHPVNYTTFLSMGLYIVCTCHPHNKFSVDFCFSSNKSVLL